MTHEIYLGSQVLIIHFDEQLKIECIYKKQDKKLSKVFSYPKMDFESKQQLCDTLEAYFRLTALKSKLEAINKEIGDAIDIADSSLTMEFILMHKDLLQIQNKLNDLQGMVALQD